MSDLKLISLANEFLFPVRKNFGMFSQIRWCIEDISKDYLIYNIEVGDRSNKRNAEGFVDALQLVYNIRNATLGQLGNLIPVPFFKAHYTDVINDIFRREYSGNFYNPDVDEFLLRGNVIPIIEYVVKKRDEYRKVFEEGWRGLNE
jgi:hypothetical protein